MATFSTITNELANLIRQLGVRTWADEYQTMYSYSVSELKAVYTKEGSFEALYFSALENDFCVTNKYEIMFVAPIDDEGNVEIRSLQDDLRKQMQRYLSWRLSLLSELSL